MGNSDEFEPLTETVYHDRFTQIHLGNVPPSQTYVPLMYADWFIHLAYLDHCPNVVVDALACQVPVICSSEGGTKEVADGLSLIIKEEPFDFELTDYTSPPRMEFGEKYFWKVRNGYDLSKGKVKHLAIANCAREYVDFFEEVLNAYKNG
jgi:glycosyltransferase involved in cell wall biosynthesis